MYEHLQTNIHRPKITFYIFKDRLIESYASDETPPENSMFIVDARHNDMAIRQTTFWSAHITSGVCVFKCGENREVFLDRNGIIQGNQTHRTLLQLQLIRGYHENPNFFIYNHDILRIAGLLHKDHMAALSAQTQRIPPRPLSHTLRQPKYEEAAYV